MICKKCGYKNDALQTVCIKCNSPLTDGYLMCPNCGKVIKDGTLICPRCKSEIAFREVKKDNVIIREACTPKYVISDYLSFLTIIGIMGFMVYTFLYNLVVYIKDLIVDYNTSEISTKVLLIFSNDIRLIVLIPLVFLSVYTFILRVFINKVATYEEMNNRLIKFKCFILADAVAFFTYFFVSYWPSVFNLNAEVKPVIYYIGAGYGILQLIITCISLPMFYKKAKIRTR